MYIGTAAACSTAEAATAHHDNDNYATITIAMVATTDKEATTMKNYKNTAINQQWRWQQCWQQGQQLQHKKTAEGRGSIADDSDSNTKGQLQAASLITLAAAAVMTPSSRHQPGDARLWKQQHDAVAMAVALTTTVAMQPVAMVASELMLPVSSENDSHGQP